MKKIFILVLFLPLIFSCNNSETQVEEKIEAPKEAEKTMKTNSMQNFAIVWMSNGNEELLEDNVQAQKNEFSSLMTKGTFMNAYNNTLDKGNESIVILMQAEDKKAAIEILDGMTFIKKDIAKYDIYTLGTKWYGESKNKDYTFNTYVSIWSNNPLKSAEEISTGIEELVDTQIEAVTELYEKGVVENIYFDTQMSDNIADFVMYIRAETEEEARNIANSLPFTQKELVEYKLLNVGFPWAGESLGK